MAIMQPNPFLQLPAHNRSPKALRRLKHSLFWLSQPFPGVRRGMGDYSAHPVRLKPESRAERRARVRAAQAKLVTAVPDNRASRRAPLKLKFQQRPVTDLPPIKERRPPGSVRRGMQRAARKNARRSFAGGTPPNNEGGE